MTLRTLELYVCEKGLTIKPNEVVKSGDVLE